MKALIAKIPADLLIKRVPQIERFIGVPMRGHQGSAALLSSFLQNLWGQADLISPAEGEAVLPGMLLDLMALVFSETAPAVKDMAPSDLRRRACALIREQSTDPDFDVQTTAKVLGVTPRYLQLVFSRAGETPHGCILSRRLSVAADLIRTNRSLSLTEVALQSGFNDLSSFGRAFRRRFGMSPRAYRCANS